MNNYIKKVTWRECSQGSDGSIEFDKIYQIHINKPHLNEDKIILKNK